MVVLTNRQIQEIEYLCSRDEPTSVSDLAYHFGISTRTARNDISHIVSCLDAYDLQLQHKRGAGVAIVGSPAQKRKMLEQLSNADNAVLTPDERCTIITILLLVRPCVTLSQLAECCGVSRQTVTRDMSDVEGALLHEGVRVVRRRGMGIRVDGSEISVRHAFIQLLASGRCTKEMYQILNAEDELCSHRADAELILASCESTLQLCFQDREYICTIVSFILLRISRGRCVTYGELNDQELLAQSVPAPLERAMSPLVSQDAERFYLAATILSQRIGPNPTKAESSDANAISKRAKQISNQLVQRLGEYQGLDEGASKEVIAMLTEHLRAALYRQQNGIALHDENMEAYIQLTSPLIYEFTQNVLTDCGLKLPSSEIAYIAVYLSSIFESSGAEDLVPVVLFVCTFGLATSALLKSRLQRLLFGCTLVGPLSVDEAKAYLACNEADLAVASCEFATDRAPVLKVSPMLTQNDINLIKDYVNQLPYTKMSTRFIERYLVSGDGNSHHRVSDYVNSSCVQVVDSCESWDNAIRLAARPLVNSEFMEPRYVETMIHAVRELGAYMVLTPETAYVHAGVNDGINDDCTAVLICRHPIRFGAERTKNVRTIVVLGIKHKERSCLLSLASIFSTQQNVTLMRNPILDAQMVLRMHD